MNTFFNTIGLGSTELSDAVLTAKHQNERILGIFKELKRPCTPHSIHELYIKLWGFAPITSIRRAISTLTEQGKLKKMDLVKKEKYGKPNYRWQYFEN